MNQSTTPAYHNFPVIEETDTSGWRMGTITALDHDQGCEYGDGFVIAPDGSRAGLVWETGCFPVREILPPDDQRWGVYAVAFPIPVRSVDDLVRCFRKVLPELARIYVGLKRAHGA